MNGSGETLASLSGLPQQVFKPRVAAMTDVPKIFSISSFTAPCSFWLSRVTCGCGVVTNGLHREFLGPTVPQNIFCVFQVTFLKEMLLRLSIKCRDSPIPDMSPTLSLPAPKLATENHPYFVGLAHLRSLLLHEEIIGDEAKTDAVLDVIGLLLRQAPAGHVVKAFCRMRRVCGRACYLALYRLRRWMEGEIMVRVGTRAWQPLELKFVPFRKVTQDYSRAEWEANLEAESPTEVPVIFCWRGNAALEADRAALSEILTA